MITQITNTLIYAFALIIGGGVGYGFGKIQTIAHQRYAKRQEIGKFKNGMAAVPGSMQRTALFLIILALVQIGLPVLFTGNIQWLVSAGIVIGYGWTLVQQLRKRANG